MPPQAASSKAMAPIAAGAWPPEAASHAQPFTRRGADAWRESASPGTGQIRFGPFLVDCAGSRFLRDGAEIRIRSQVYEVIKVLATRAGCEVRFAELIAEAWKGINVSRHTVVVTIAEARKALGEYRNWIVYRPGRGYRLTIPVADDQMKIGWRTAQRCTREGLEKALERFRAAAADRFDRRPFDAIARVYLTLGAVGAMSPSEAMAAFQNAHRRAVDLFGDTPALTADLAHAMHLFDRHREAAEGGLLESAREREDPITYLRLTLLYAGQRRFDCAAESLRRARVLDPLDPGLPAAEMFFRLAQGEFRSALRAGAAAIEVQPYFYLDRYFYAEALEFSGRADEALEQYRLAQTLAPDIPWLRAAEAHCLARNGCSSQAARLLGRLRRLRKTAYVDSFFLAPVLHALDRPNEAFAELWRARRENSASLWSVDVDPKLASLRKDPRFAAFRTALFRS